MFRRVSCFSIWEGPKARVSCFVFQIFRACGALGLRGRLRRALRDQYLNSTPKASIKVYDDCTYSTKRNHCIRRARFASASASCRALPALRFSASDSWRRSKAAAAAAAVAARCASAAQAVSRAEGQRTFWDQNSFGGVSCFTFRWVAVFRVSLFGRQPCFVFHFSVFHVFRVSAGRGVKHRWGPNTSNGSSISTTMCVIRTWGLT